jgi:hypothetical protein
MSKRRSSFASEGAGFSFRLPIDTASLLLETTRILGPALLARL